MKVDTICIIGVGLLGGSTAMAIKKFEICSQIIGYDAAPSHLTSALKLGLIDNCANSLEEAVSHADIIVVATPPATIANIIIKILPWCKQAQFITDVGSFKEQIAKEVSQHDLNHLYVGSHPIAGTEHSGPEAAIASLLPGARCIVTPTHSENKVTVERVCDFWRSLQMQVVKMEAEHHDQVFAAVSHLPHVVAYALVNSVDEASGFTDDIIGMFGGGYKDTTRIAYSHPAMWRDVCLGNREQLLFAIDCFSKELNKIRNAVAGNQSQDLYDEFKKARDERAKLINESAPLISES